MSPNTQAAVMMPLMMADDTALDMSSLIRMTNKRPTIDKLVFPRSQRKRRRDARRAHAAGAKNAFQKK